MNAGKTSSSQQQGWAVWLKLLLGALTGHSVVGYTTIVQLVRNFLCCLKDLNLFGSTFLYSPFLLDIPSPLHKTTWLELLISVTQLYACISLTRSGAVLLSSSLGKLRRVRKLLYLQSDNEGGRATRESSKLATAAGIVSHHLIKERSCARRNVVTGACLLTIGPAFFWLFAHSWHVSETTWIGGVPALMRALTSMEVALLILLYYMLIDAWEMLAKSARMMAFVKLLKQEGLNPDTIDSERYTWVTDGDWTPFWAEDVPLFSKAGKDNIDRKLLNGEISKISQVVAGLVDDKAESKGRRRNSRSRSRERRKSKERPGGGDGNASLVSAAERLVRQIPALRMEAFREYIYFALNFAAFYGYMLCVLAYHWSDVDQPGYIRAIKLGMTNDDADWRGNFFGDLMWTIEPVVALVSPMVIDALTPKALAVKAKMD